MRRIIFVLALCLAGIANAEAKNAIDVTTDSCLESNPSTAGMVECFTRSEKQWDDELNRVYKVLQGKLKPAGQEALKQAEKEWMAQRDKEFDLINAIHAQMDGTMWIPVMVNKRADVVKARAVALQAYVDLLTEAKQ